MTHKKGYPKHIALSESSATTAWHMIDAIGFLIRVAEDASMHGIARRLGAVRKRLLDIARNQRGSPGPRGRQGRTEDMIQ